MNNDRAAEGRLRRPRYLPETVAVVQASSQRESPSCKGNDMSDEFGNHKRPRGRPASAPRKGPVIAAGVLSSAAVAAGCGGGSGGPGVAGAGASTGAARSASGGSSKGSALAFSQCMRSHGIRDFPDPNSSGQLQVSAGPGSDLDPNNPQFAAAQQACRSLSPKPPTGGSDQRRVAAAMLRFARCMRAHGITDFPDPQSNGDLGVKVQPGSDLNPRSPQFQSAQTACHSDLPGGGVGAPQTSANGGGA